jgi:hypothetical protein
MWAFSLLLNDSGKVFFFFWGGGGVRADPFKKGKGAGMLKVFFLFVCVAFLITP